MISRLYLVGGIVLALLAGAGTLYMAGRRDAVSSIENKNLQATERQRAERDQIDADARELDDPGLCPWLNGVWRNGQCD